VRLFNAGCLATDTEKIFDLA